MGLNMFREPYFANPWSGNFEWQNRTEILKAILHEIGHEVVLLDA